MWFDLCCKRLSAAAPGAGVLRAVVEAGRPHRALAVILLVDGGWVGVLEVVEFVSFWLKRLTD